MNKLKINELIKFNEEFKPQMLLQGDGYRVPLICMQPGQGIPPHPSGAGIFYIIKGKGFMTVDGNDHPIEAGDMIHITANETRGIRCEEELIAFAVRLGD